MKRPHPWRGWGRFRKPVARASFDSQASSFRRIADVSPRHMEAYAIPQVIELLQRGDGATLAELVPLTRKQQAIGAHLAVQASTNRIRMPHGSLRHRHHMGRAQDRPSLRRIGLATQLRGRANGPSVALRTFGAGAQARACDGARGIAKVSPLLMIENRFESEALVRNRALKHKV